MIAALFVMLASPYSDYRDCAYSAADKLAASGEAAPVVAGAALTMCQKQERALMEAFSPDTRQELMPLTKAGVRDKVIARVVTLRASPQASRQRY